MLNKKLLINAFVFCLYNLKSNIWKINWMWYVNEKSK